MAPQSNESIINEEQQTVAMMFQILRCIHFLFFCECMGTCHDNFTKPTCIINLQATNTDGDKFNDWKQRLYINIKGISYEECQRIQAMQF